MLAHKVEHAADMKTTVQGADLGDRRYRRHDDPDGDTAADPESKLPDD